MWQITSLLFIARFLPTCGAPSISSITKQLGLGSEPRTAFICVAASILFLNTSALLSSLKNWYFPFEWNQFYLRKKDNFMRNISKWIKYSYIYHSRMLYHFQVSCKTKTIHLSIIMKIPSWNWTEFSQTDLGFLNFQGKPSAPVVKSKRAMYILLIWFESISWQINKVFLWN